MLALLAALLLAAPKNPEVLSLSLVQQAEAAPQDYSTTTLKAYAESVAADNDLGEIFVATLHCESRWQWDAVGDHGTSLGIAQFRFPERDWGVSSSTVLNPYSAINLMASAWKEGKAAKWTCYRLLKKNWGADGPPTL